MLAGVIVAAAVSFIVSALILKSSKAGEEDLTAAAEKMQEMKGRKSEAAAALADKEEEPENSAADISADQVSRIIFACDAGMGSSAMGASILRNKVKKADLDIDVTNTSINNLPNDADIVITHKDLTDRAKAKAPQAVHISVDNFLNSPKYDELIEKLKN